MAPRKPPKRRSLRGKGPTPRAENRPAHKKYRGDEPKRSDAGRKRVERKRIDSKRGDRRRDFRREPKEHVEMRLSMEDIEAGLIE